MHWYVNVHDVLHVSGPRGVTSHLFPCHFGLLR
uniref:Uncharacterized protein n=1 Tax=Anguilla anguilla TaxID=7936 RepID=A0A0E9V5Y9_ANGAN